jgi:arabinan endo-1,5-alpha-L-arabinosidase
MNRIFKKTLSGLISASILISSTAIPIVSAEDTLPSDELLFHLTFDENGAEASSFEATVGGIVKKNGNTALAPSVDEECGNALSITTNSAGNYLELPKGILNGKDAASFSFWIKPNSGWAFMTTPVNGAQEYLFEKYLGMLATTSNLKAENYNNNSARPADINVNGSYSDWQYVTVVYTVTGTKVYLNGSLAASDNTAFDIKSLLTSDASTWIGHGNWNNGEGFSGMIDDFRIYGKALNEKEIELLSAKAVKLEQDKLIKEKNCLEIDTHFYADYQISENGKDITVSLPTIDKEKYSVITASYSEGVLSNIVTKTQADVSEDRTITFIDLKKNDTDEVKVFVWNSLNGIQPLNGNEVFQITSGEKITATLKITNYTQSKKSIKCEIIPYNSDGTIFSSGEPVPTEQEINLDIMESKYLLLNINGNSSVAYYKAVVTDMSDNKTYDAGYLPVTSVSFPDASPADSANTTEGVHDPTIFKDPVSGKYYAYSSHNLVFESDDLINWVKHDYTKTVTVPVKAKEFIDKNYSNTTANGTYWAPDLYYKEGDEYPYWFYLSTSCGLGGRNSVISLIKAKSPGLWDGEYKDEGVVIASKEENDYNTNAIDANIFTDSDGKTYFIWGSFWRGIHGAELDTDTGLVKGVDYTSDTSILSSCKKFGSRLFSTPSGVQGPEGAYTVYNEDTGYRYMFTSYGWLGTNYNIRVARTNKTFSDILSGKDPHRQLTDQNDRLVGTTFSEQTNKNELWGYKMSGSFQLGDGIEYVGSGHNSVFRDDDGEWYLVQHCRKVADAIAYLQVKKILWTEDGWPVISPLVYAGEKEQTIPREMLYGTWDLSSVGQTIFASGISDVGNRNSERNVDLPVHSSQIILQADGTLGNALGKWEYDNDHTITITFSADGDKNNYEFYKAGDQLKMFVLTGYDKDKRENAIVMTGTDQNGTANFAKKASAMSQSTKPEV